MRRNWAKNTIEGSNNYVCEARPSIIGLVISSSASWRRYSDAIKMHVMTEGFGCHGLFYIVLVEAMALI